MSDKLKHLAGFGPGDPATVHPPPGRGAVTHVVIMDGTMSSLEEGFETNAGRTFRLLSEMAPSRQISLKYEAGIQWQGLHRALDVMAGVGLNRQIRRAYGFIASRYRPGDQIFLFGYSRGAYAVRSLAGLIDTVGLLTKDNATERNVRQAFRHYRLDPDSLVAQAFRTAHCHPTAPIEMVGVWDTVRALGFRFPLLWKFAPTEFEFHSHAPGNTIKNGFHALALDETRRVFEPVLWADHPDFKGRLEQAWFAGSHGDVGGHLTGFEPARPLANIPLVWMLERAERCGLPLPEGWQDRLPQNANAPSVGTFRGLARLFLQRRARQVGVSRTERLHPSVDTRRTPLAFKFPWAARPDLGKLRR